MPHLVERSRRCDGVDEGSAYLFGAGLVTNFNEPGRRDLNRGFALQPFANVICIFTTPLSNSLCQKHGVADNRQHGYTVPQCFGCTDDLPRHVNDRGMAFLQQSNTVGRDAISQSMSAPTQSKFARGFRSLERCKIHRVMVFGIRLRHARDHAARKDKPGVIDQGLSRKIDQRVFAAARWANDKHKSATFNI